VEDYNGERSAKAIVETMKGKIPNHVTKIADKDLESFLAKANDSAKAILFTEKGTTSAILKSVAVDFLGSITFGQVRDKERATCELFGIEKFPTLVLLPGGPDEEPRRFHGELVRAGMIPFLSQIAPPNPDPAPAKVKMPKKKDEKKDAKAKEAFESASSSHASSEGPSAAASATDETLEEASQPTESPDPIDEDKQAPVIVQELAPPIAALKTSEELTKACLEEGSSTCILVLVPATHGGKATTALTSFAEIAYKHAQVKRQLFPFYELPDDNAGAAALRTGLGLVEDIEVIAVNGRRNWWRHYEGHDLTQLALEDWVDAIRMGEGAKAKIPDGIIVEQPVTETPAEPEPEAEPVVDSEPVAEMPAEPEPEAEPVADKTDEHDEL